MSPLEVALLILVLLLIGWIAGPIWAIFAALCLLLLYGAVR